MAAFTQARQTGTTTDGTYGPRLLALDDDRVAGTSVNAGHERRREQKPGDIARPYMDSGVQVPTSSFRRVEIQVVDPNGEPLSDINWIMSATYFPTAARVDDEGRASMWLLSVTYDTFMAIKGAASGPNLVWYSNPERSADITPTVQSSGTVILEPVYISNLNVGGGVSLGV